MITMNFIDGKFPPFTSERYEKISHLSKKVRRNKLRKWRKEFINENYSSFIFNKRQINIAIKCRHWAFWGKRGEIFYSNSEEWLKEFPDFFRSSYF